MLTDKYIHGIPEDSRAARDPRYLKPGDITEEKLDKIRRLNRIAEERGEPLSQMALAWVLRQNVISTALIGASRPEQIRENLKALASAPFSEAERKEIEEVLSC